MFCHTEGMVQKIAVTLVTEREKRTRLVRELAKIDPREERQMAEQSLGDCTWPEY